MKRIISLFRTRDFNIREKILFVIFGITLIIWISNSLILKPQADELDGLELELKHLEEEIVNINQIFGDESDVKEELNYVKSKITKIGNSYFSSLDQTQLIYYLEEIFIDNGLMIVDMFFSEIQTMNIDGLEVQYIDISIPFEGEYKDIIDAINHIKNGPLKVIVESLALTNLNEQMIEAKVVVKVLCLENIIDIPRNNIIFSQRDTEDTYEDFNPFEENLELNYDEKVEDDNDTQDQPPNNNRNIDNTDNAKSENDKDIINKIVLDNFDNNIYKFASSHDYISGNINLFTENKNTYLRFEYYIESGTNEENRAYIDISDKDIEFRYPISKLSLNTKSFNYSFGNLGIRFRTQDGQNIDITIAEGISWTGWYSVEFSLPSKLSQYPLKLTHIYYEIPKNREDMGVLIFDKLEMEQPNNLPEMNFFYMIKVNDTLASISEKIYGTDKFVDEIIEINNLSSSEKIFPGKILILKRR